MASCLWPGPFGLFRLRSSIDVVRLGFSQSREERSGNEVVPPAWKGQSFLSTRTPLDKRAQEGEVVGEIVEHALKVALQPLCARA
jgi:hypothetical protein